MDLSTIKYNDAGLVPAIVQDYSTRQVLMMAWMNEDALKQSIETKKATFYSRSRQQLWVKGETSGNFQTIISIDYDCDGDTLLLQVIPAGPACHTGNTSCFYRNMMTDETNALGNIDILPKLFALIADRKSNPVEGSYTNYLFREGVDKIGKKIGEESAETIIAAKNNDPDELIYESSDLIYHLFVMLNNQGVDLTSIFKELTKRHK
ncbi:bifunctional phosphoribosyl-AMP cyclohydrolase/phosphoribosyl-ATP diphosphatase HisIE [Acetobacterium fimetarium]|uniref:Histidine biosynthesis bifunctional protein HisIE n=1 Tax=Acetobacterium fimetarium TaxID=52691 RepID=A0ABR6WYM4_9FIRM|nr:bifunctional phosphoribosyl-AMP cyclohydrolase/phosphoribosyl-ATP diphosphatase HisIE [Acetobacterium fimetarium]MBC3805366.1 bifunctional phosphoribosyl-AMP cyclohydrolase/phosphoribosyl-ATP diphosphatase HisIE [Acetobacterium fimetarium]